MPDEIRRMSAQHSRTVKPAGSTTICEEFGPYLVYERLGIGGMATVHRAKKRGIAGFERGVALKRMLPHLADDAEFIHSFVREAKLASLLVHPNIAQIYDFGRVGSVYYIAMEHVDGFDVSKMLRHSNRHKDPLPLPVVLSILCELCDALEYAHTFVDEHGQPQGIVHRDVSPSNLIVAHSGHLKVIDFGIAKASARPLHTESRRIKGKLGYMSPEAVGGRALGPTSDVFSAGVVAHELLTARPLFTARTDYDTLLRLREAEIPPPSRRNPNVPAALDEIVLAALARDPERRLPSARAFRQGLDDVAEQAGIRFSARDVTEWRARVATADDPWRSRSTLSAGAPAGASRSFPEPRSSRALSPDQRAQSQLIGVRQAAPEPLASRGLGAVDPAAPARPGSDDERSAALAWGSDAAPARPLRPTADQGAAPPPPPAAPAIGASIITAAAPGRHSLLRHALVLLGSFAAVLAVYQLVLRPRKPLAPPPPVTSIRFVVQPADAVVEVGGKEVGRQSPFETPLGPGVYSIHVRRDGYQPWTREVTLREGDRPTIQVALDPGTAQLSASSQPPGLAVQLDGEPLEPGARRTEAAIAAVAAVAHPSALAEPERPERNDRNNRTDRTRRPTTAPARTASNAPAEPAIRAPEPVAEPPPAPPEPSAPLPPPEPAWPWPVAPPPVPSPPKEPARPRPAAPPPVASKAPPLVAPTAVTKLAGELPAMQVTSATDAFADVIAKLCIDEHGRVSSVRIIKALPEIAGELQRSLAGWRYQPYTSAAGQASPACFPVSLRVVFKRSD